MASLDFIRAGVWLVLGCSMLTRPSGATGWGLTLIANAIGPLVTGAVMYPLRCGQIGAAGLALLTLALGPAIVRELLTPIGHSEELRTGNT
ncbi:MAG: hypothetical protein ACRDS0_32305 [Pseudonocardiaceae bacterium]